MNELRRAKWVLEKPSLAARLSDTLGGPIEKGLDLLPDRWAQTLHSAVHAALTKALEVAVVSLENPSRRRGERFHRFAVIATGAAGGAFGLPGLAVELPVSTTLMLRSIADIARREGEDLEDIQARLACLSVFALGGRAKGDDAAETGYLAVRSALAKSVSEAARYITQRGLLDESAPALVRFVGAVASRFGIAVSEKIAAMAVPAIGAAGGAIVNSIFIDHFNNVARGHFVVRRLERIYDTPTVEAAYRKLTIGNVEID